MSEMDTSEKVFAGFCVCFVAFIVLLVVAAIIGPSWSEITVVYNCDDPESETHIIA